MLNVLIAGCGDVGCELARQLLSGGSCKIWGLRRSIAKLPEGIESIQADLRNPESFGQWPENIDYVVYSVATDGYSPEQYQEAYVDGLGNLLNHLKASNIQPRRILFTSSTSVYHQNNGERVDEASPCQPENFPGQILLNAEELLSASGTPSTSVRFGGIYGPGRNRLIQRVMEGEGCTKEPVIFSNRIHRDDCGGILAHLIHRDIEGKEIHPVYLGVDNNPAPMHDVLHWLAAELQVKLDDNNPSPQRANKRCDNTLIKSSGYQFKFPDYRQGYNGLLEHIRNRGQEPDDGLQQDSWS